MKQLFIVIGVVVAMMAILIPAIPAAAANPNGPPDKWEAKPPHHEYYIAPEGKQISGSTSYYEPKQIRHAYGLDLISNNGTLETIGIVDAYDDPTAASDLATFSNNFGLPAASFQKIYAQHSKPKTNSSWALETSLDIEWAHAIAPGAKILLVEASSASFSSLLQAVDVAVQNGATVVSMSWGGGEFSGESSYDSHFNKPGVTFTAASGDSGTGVIYPAVSPYVVSVGGTTLPLDVSGNLTGPETAWSGSGGGISSYELEPGYQSNFSIPSTGNKRGNPDVSYDANPNTGFLVYDSTPYNGQSGWWIVGGTSAGAPQWAAIIALANQGRTITLSSNNLITSPEYSAAGSAATYASNSNYRDITSGSNGSSSLSNARTGYDFVTGLGSPQANNLVPYLAAH